MNRFRMTILGGLAILLSSPLMSADIDGDWGLSLTASEGATYIDMTITVDGQEATATSEGSELTGTYIDGKLDLEGELYLVDAGYASATTMSARLEGDKLKGNMTWESYSLTIDGSRK